MTTFKASAEAPPQASAKSDPFAATEAAAIAGADPLKGHEGVDFAAVSSPESGKRSETSKRAAESIDPTFGRGSY